MHSDPPIRDTAHGSRTNRPVLTLETKSTEPRTVTKDRLVRTPGECGREAHAVQRCRCPSHLVFPEVVTFTLLVLLNCPCIAQLLLVHDAPPPPFSFLRSRERWTKIVVAWQVEFARTIRRRGRQKERKKREEREEGQRAELDKRD